MANGCSPIGQMSAQRAQRMQAEFLGLSASLVLNSKIPEVSLVIGASILTADNPIMAPPKITLLIFEGCFVTFFIKKER